MSSKSHLPNATFRRQRLPSTDSDTSLIVSDGLSADEFCFAETEHPNQVLKNKLLLKYFLLILISRDILFLLFFLLLFPSYFSIKVVVHKARQWDITKILL